MRKKIKKLYDEDPHKQNAQLIVAGMLKEGCQTGFSYLMFQQIIIKWQRRLSRSYKGESGRLLGQGKSVFDFNIF
ncbi:hypothetical protein [Kriegella aquimaris]|uniref:hypothetical protein n=1 Tax=Kriegella aquimaris TaxID=192904 RepID=UPI000B7CDFEC|nr:hypothetical protein [Kriegella aquimaris]